MNDAGIQKILRKIKEEPLIPIGVCFCLNHFFLAFLSWIGIVDFLPLLSHATVVLISRKAWD